MRVASIYLDTSFISHMDAPEVPDKMKDTRRLWEAIQGEMYKATVSNILLEEVLRCPEPKQSFLLSCLNELAVEPVSETQESLSLVQAYQKHSVLRPQSMMI